jgi:hypothetical protein
VEFRLLGEVQLQVGDRLLDLGTPRQQAVLAALLVDALTIATSISNRGEQARAHTGLGHAHTALGDSTLARHHYTHALTLYTDLGSPDADTIRTHLSTTDHRQPNTR